MHHAVGMSLRIDQRNFDALHLGGLVALQLGNAEQALRLLSAAHRVNPRDRVCNLRLGLAERASGQLESAEKRLRVLGSLDTLGAGFTLASQDLDIRGAGNLLGEEQSGQMRDVGYELYQSMLEEAIARIKAGGMEGLSEADDQWAPQINLGVPVLIPEDYVPDLDVRLGLYRRLSALSTKVELEGFAAELIDRFGKLPREVSTLLLVVRIKAMCRKAGIAKLDGGPKGATIQFHNDKFASPAGLVAFIQDQKGLAKIKDNKIVVRRDWATEADKIKGAFAIARDLAEKAKG